MRTFFESHLAEEVVKRIVHMLSERPKHVSSLRYVDPKDVLNALGDSEKLRKAAITKFKSAEMTRETNRARTSLCGLEKGLLVNDDTLFAPILSLLGSTLRKLIIDASVTFSLSVAVALASPRGIKRICRDIVERDRTLVQVLASETRRIIHLELRDVNVPIRFRRFRQFADGAQRVEAATSEFLYCTGGK